MSYSTVNKKDKHISGYKIVDARGCGINNYQYEIGCTYRHDGQLVMCMSGLHYSLNAKDCMLYYNRTLHKYGPLRYFAVSDISTASTRIIHYGRIATDAIVIQKELSKLEWNNIIQ